MKRIILAIIAVLISITLSYAESCSSGEGSLSYQISGCGEQSRACCGGNWCSWGVTSCASCTDTYTYNDYNCVGNVSNACAGTYRQHYNRSVTDNCGGCSYSGWNHYDTSNWCSYYQSCDRQYTSNTYYGNCGSGSLTYYYYKDASNTCASCTYGDWVHYSSSGDGRQWLQSCDSRQYTSSGDSSGACSGEIRYYYYRDLSNNCNSCDYGSWVHYDTSDSRQYTQSCTATGDSTACSNVSSSYCAGTATRSRSVTGTCGSCSYSDWGGWSTGGCTPWVGCDRQYTSNTYYGNCGSGSLTYYYYKDASNTCASCTYGDWVHYSSSGDGRQWLQSCDSRQYTSSGDSSGACSGEIRYYYYRDLSNNCNSCDYGSWVHYDTSDSRQYTQSCTATSESRNCSGNVSGACAGTQSRSRSVTGTCGSCSYGSWGSWTGSCTYTQSCTATSESRNCSGNVTNACAGTQTRTRTVAGTCGSCSYNSWGSWTGTCTYTQSCTDTSKTETESRNCSGNVSGACAGTQTRTRTCTRSVTSSCGSCSYGSWSCGAWSEWSGSCTYTQSCSTTGDSTSCSNVSSSYCAGTATRSRSVTGTCGSCSYSDWGGWSTGGCTPWVGCDRQYTSNTYYGNCGSGSLTYYYYRDANNTCGSCGYGDWVHYSSSGDGRQWVQSCDSRQYTSSGDSSGACSGEIRYYYYRDLTNSCNSCDYGSWVHYDTSDSRLYTQSCTATTQACSGNVSGACAGNRTRSVTGSCGSCSYSGWSDSGCSYTQSCTATSESKACSSVSSSYCSGTATRTRSVTGTCGSCSYSSWSSWNTSNCGSCSCDVAGYTYCPGQGCQEFEIGYEFGDLSESTYSVSFPSNNCSQSVGGRGYGLNKEWGSGMPDWIKSIYHNGEPAWFDCTSEGQMWMDCYCENQGRAECFAYVCSSPC